MAVPSGRSQLYACVSGHDLTPAQPLAIDTMLLEGLLLRGRDRFSKRLNKHRIGWTSQHCKGLVTNVSGPQCNVCPGTFIPPPRPLQNSARYGSFLGF